MIRGPWEEIFKDKTKSKIFVKKWNDECFPNQYIPVPEPLSDIEISTKTDPAQEKQKWFGKQLQFHEDI